MSKFTIFQPVVIAFTSILSSISGGAIAAPVFHPGDYTVIGSASESSAVAGVHENGQWTYDSGTFGFASLNGHWGGPAAGSYSVSSSSAFGLSAHGSGDITLTSGASTAPQIGTENWIEHEYLVDMHLPPGYQSVTLVYQNYQIFQVTHATSASVIFDNWIESAPRSALENGDAGAWTIYDSGPSEQVQMWGAGDVRMETTAVVSVTESTVFTLGSSVLSYGTTFRHLPGTSSLDVSAYNQPRGTLHYLPIDPLDSIVAFELTLDEQGNAEFSSFSGAVLGYVSEPSFSVVLSPVPEAGVTTSLIAGLCVLAGYVRVRRAVHGVPPSA